MNNGIKAIGHVNVVRLCILSILLTAASTLWALADQPAAAGFLLGLKGGVIVLRNKVKIEAADRYHLQIGDHIVTDKTSGCEAVHFAAAKLYSLPANSDAIIESGRIALMQSGGARKEAVVLRQMARQVVARVGGAHTEFSGKILGVNARQAPTRLSDPAPFGAVDDGPIVLVWRNSIAANPGASRTTIELTVTPDGEADAVIREDLPINSASFMLPAGTLKAGTLYHWQVSAAGAGIGLNQTGGPLWVLSQEERNEVAEVEKEAADLRRIALGSSAGDMLVALTTERVGLFLKALDAYRAVLLIDPDNSNAGASAKQLESLMHRNKRASL